MNDKQRRRLDISGFIIALGLLVIAILLRFDASHMPPAPAYARIGPEAATNVVALCLLVLGLATAYTAWRGDGVEPEAADWGPVALITLAFVAVIAIIGLGGGFILASAVLFAMTSRAFGRHALLVDFAVGFALGLGAYLIFAKLLTLTLPSGPLEHLF
ncbi:MULTISPECIES: tripartite tricarboxylate transporter TctB family protein [unclassified Chelatococcus]|jgi:putative tricarboxylic transport membrane protein|uniref:tripartite tricarboxylate transporter TctB family protein n=1 Tax=unclassified Chelatococcus TaxID=2638111 RepID=UPI001BD045BF|nr:MULTISPECIES: tripartite tricarboxylate transporter TctB family protein [unclassified Chelatococcus]CAH1670266.1 putative tricarboxylic transport membrane protein [Hyphomicrobiales bacterium]MBS7739229.1 tripartite tricarboxylate transporter TctB family protein [Chelatococcus sp. HY11]MBX3543719.1 tripartite tricarboxylate transporter TctB family protein [Chelatococcus sp.]MCO5076238.1 tripartite tricarboxylate transporter TctB family protein [Chelatococcus sp.]CAH1677551.1 putative tricarb